MSTKVKTITLQILALIVVVTGMWMFYGQLHTLALYLLIVSGITMAISLGGREFDQPWWERCAVGSAIGFALALFAQVKGM
jgi:hypothetical protein